MPFPKIPAKFNTLSGTLLSSSNSIYLSFLRKIYQLLISPFIHSLCGPSFGCRFVPTCSEYATESIQLHGWAKGSLLSFWRICRCQPFARAGYDPVPRGIAKSLNPNQGR